jgi:hypothetical protein
MINPVQNQELHDALEAWVQAVLPVLKAHPWFSQLVNSKWMLRAEITVPESVVGQLEASQLLFDVIARTPEFNLHTADDTQSDEDAKYAEFSATQTIAAKDPSPHAERGLTRAAQATAAHVPEGNLPDASAVQKVREAA